jgi:hypothetical protein
MSDNNSTTTTRFIRGDPNSVNLEAIMQQNTDENKNIYEIETPLYPLPELVKYYTENGFDYNYVYDKHVDMFPYDRQWHDWWRAVKQVAKARKLQTEPIKREVTVIYRYKVGDKEKLVWSERFIGIDTKTGKNTTFKHLRGVYWRHIIETEYNEATDNYEPKLKGQVKIYSIDYKPEMLDELFRYAPINDPQELHVVVMNNTYAGNGFFNREEYKNLTIENLCRIALAAKGLTHTNYKLSEFKDKDPEDVTQALKVVINDPKALELIANLVKQNLTKNKDKDKENKEKTTDNTSNKNPKQQT